MGNEMSLALAILSLVFMISINAIFVDVASQILIPNKNPMRKSILPGRELSLLRTKHIF